MFSIDVIVPLMSISIAIPFLLYLIQMVRIHVTYMCMSYNKIHDINMLHKTQIIHTINYITGKDRCLFSLPFCPKFVAIHGTALPP